MAHWIDITKPISETLPVYPGHAPFRRTQVATVETDGYTLTHFSMGSHCGTHMDAPLHFVKDGLAIDQAPLDLLLGEALLIGIADGQDLNNIPDGTQRLLIRSNGYRGLTMEDAELLIGKGVHLIGIDRLCVARNDLDAPVHRKILGNGIWVIENLEFASAVDGVYDFACLPMKIEGNEGAPARAAIRYMRPGNASSR